VPLEFLVPSVYVEKITNMIEIGTIHERLSQLMEMEEDKILVGFLLLDKSVSADTN
jgi:hypothetical protein